MDEHLKHTTIKNSHVRGNCHLTILLRPKMHQHFGVVYGIGFFIL